ncbi:MAG: alpha-amylase family glycosyl hydrolase [Egibacteraceae bacterium]
MAATSPPSPWWHDRVGYQVYLPSFADADGDGWGDLAGLTDRLDHLAQLGAGLLWLSPIHPSPMADHGYDVADYTGVHPRLGTLADVDRLVAAAEARDIKVLLDLVPNHTSVAHPWFERARRDRDDPYRAYYHWRDPAPDGGPPNNWTSVFGGPAWTLDEATGQYYLHLFAPEQPDLNWDNPAVAEEFDAILRFWLDRGVAGFRIDVAHRLVKAPGLPDQPVVPPERRPTQLSGHSADHHAIEHIHDEDQPGLKELHARWRRVADPYDALLLGEIYLLEPATLARYLADQRGLHLGFSFGLVEAGWDPEALARTLRIGEVTGPHLAWVQSSHDRSRAVTRYGGGSIGRRRALLVATLTAGLPALPVLYQGEELGLDDGEVPVEAMQDPLALRSSGAVSRDPARTPMPWRDEPGLGFSSGQPWLPEGGRRRADTVEAQEDDPDSPLAAHRRLLATRASHADLRHGEVRWVGEAPPLLAYDRGQARVVANVGAAPVALPLDGTAWRVAFATGGLPEGARLGDETHLPAEQAAILVRDTATPA